MIYLHLIINFIKFIKLWINSE